MITVYAIHCRICDRQYIGATRQFIGMRLRKHLGLARVGGTTALAEDIRRHGDFAFSVRALVRVPTLKQAHKLEREFIRYFDTLAPNGFNLQSGGFRDYELCETGRQHIGKGQIAARARREAA